ncbi:hypothetical protein VKT23_017892 [Stygiomarasmius scandens]|uniref:Uncharacterized protein n=1 Tax=Marasmiellus scandens TaxID=2682957 RepID=A0ABR1ITT3_9AGAR
MNHFVCIGHSNNTVTSPPMSPGISDSLKWRPGGIPGSAPPFPMNFACDTEDEAQQIWTLMQPWVLAHYNLTAVAQITALKADANMQWLGQLLDRVPDRKFWAVRLGQQVGVYFNGCEAMDTMDAAREAQFRHAFAFRHFLDAVGAMISVKPHELHPVYNYNPGKHPMDADRIRSTARSHTNTLSFDPPSSESTTAGLSHLNTTGLINPQSAAAAAVAAMLRDQSPSPPKSQDVLNIITVSPIIEAVVPGTPTRSGGASSSQGTPVRRSVPSPAGARTPGRHIRRELNYITCHYF